MWCIFIGHQFYQMINKVLFCIKAQYICELEGKISIDFLKDKTRYINFQLIESHFRLVLRYYLFLVEKFEV